MSPAAYLKAGNQPPPVTYCQKKGFPDRGHAQRTLRRMGNSTGKPVASNQGKGKNHAWKCSACGLWHIGTAP